MSKKATHATIINKFKSFTDSEAVKAHFVTYFPAVPDGEPLADFYEAYVDAYKRTSSVHRSDTGRTYSAASPLSADDFANLVNSTLALGHGLSLSMKGQMLYCSGNTKAVKDSLKALGYWYSGQHKCWYAKTVNADFAKSLKKCLKKNGLGNMVVVAG